MDKSRASNQQIQGIIIIGATIVSTLLAWSIYRHHWFSVMSNSIILGAYGIIYFETRVALRFERQLRAMEDDHP